MPKILMERLAALEHERWSNWFKWQVTTEANQFGVGRQADGSFVISKENFDRWWRQANTAYAELSMAEQESDRREVRKTLAVISHRHREQLTGIGLELLPDGSLKRLVQP